MARRLLFPLVFLLGIPGITAADDGAVEGVGGVIAPMKEHPSVVMEKMLVDIHVNPDEATVNCKFVFHNTGKATTVRMGFPESGYSPGFEGEPDGFAAFATAVDGKPVKTRTEGLQVEKEGSWHRWRVKEVRFDADQTRTVTVSYAAGTGFVSDGSRFFEYPVSTGASWKGAIEYAMVRVHVKGKRGFAPPSAPHYGGKKRRRGSASPLASDWFRVVGPGVYEWEARNFEPAAQDRVVVDFQPIYIEVKFGETGVANRYTAQRSLRGGTLMLPVRDLTDGLRVGWEEKGSQLTLVRGSKTVVLRKGSREYSVNGVPRLLPHAPIAEDGGTTLVPMAAVALALGADVTYDAKARVAAAHFPRIAVFDGNLEPQTVHYALECMRTALAPGWAPPDASEYDQDVLRYVQRHQLPAPWACFGDFNGDGAKDAATILRRGDQLGVSLILTARRAGYFSFQWLSEPRDVGPAKANTMIELLQTLGPGTVEYWKEGETTPRSGRLDLRHDGVKVIFYEKAAELYYWDDGTHRFAMVQTAD